MSDIKVCYSGFLSASSGMGEAARNIVAALYTSGVELTTEDIPNIAARIDLGNSYSITKSLIGRPIEYDFKIIHITPDLVTNYFTPQKYHIFHLFWETDSLPTWWVWALNLCDEIWTGDQRQADNFKKSGVWRNIWVCPQPIDTSITSANKFTIKDHEGFTFYSIFQWIERKNPKGLIEAYWREFEGDKNVALLIKTFKDKFTTEEIIKIRQDIENWRKEVKLKHYPKIGLLVEAWDKKDMFRLHATGDCFVSAHRGEGFCIPAVEAMMMGKPVISTGLGGIHEHAPDDTMHKVKYEWKNVHDMNWVPWYDETQKWGEPDSADLRTKMRYIYEHQDEAKQMGERAKKYVVENLNFLRVGNMMLDRLKNIKAEIIDK